MLERVGHLALVPMRDFATTEQVAAFYEVELVTIRSVQQEHREEFLNTGYRVIRGSELGELKGQMDNPSWLKCTSQLATWDRRAVLLLGMLLRDSAVAKEVRRYLPGG